MTMHIYFNKDKDGYKKGFSGYVERSLARRFCENEIAIPYQQHLDNVYDAEQAEKEAPNIEKAEKEKAEKKKKADLLKKKADLLKKKESTKTEKADSNKPKKAEKSVKK